MSNLLWIKLIDSSTLPGVALYIDKHAPTLNTYNAGSIVIGDIWSDSKMQAGLFNFTMPKLPSGFKMRDGNAYLYKNTDKHSHTIAFKVAMWSEMTRWSAKDVCWNYALAIGSRAGTGKWIDPLGGGDPQYWFGEVTLTLDNVAAWFTIPLSLIGLTPESLYDSESIVQMVVYCSNLPNAGDYIAVDTELQSNPPYLELQIEAEGQTNFAAAPNPADKTQVKLTWTPLQSVTRVDQRIYRKTGSGGVTTGDTLLQTLDKDAVEYIDTTANDNQAYTYAVFTRLDCSKTTTDLIKSNEIIITKPGVTVFYVDAVADAHEGANINVQEKVHAHITAAGGTVSQWFVRWGDGGERWFDQALVATPEHYYTVPGVESVKARAENGDGYWSALTATTGGHSDPNPQAIAPIARLDVTPTNPAPFDEITLDASRSYDRQSNGLLTDKTFTATGAKGLGAQPQSSPLASIYYDSIGSKTASLTVKNTNLITSAQVNKSIEVLPSLTYKFADLTDTNIEEVTPDKSRNIDEAPLIGTDGAEVIQTGGRATKYALAGSCIGPNAEANLRTVEEWALRGYVVDIPIYNDDRVVTQILRGYIQAFSRQIRGGEPYTKWFNCSVIVFKRLYKVVDEAVSYTAGVGSVTNYPLGDADGDGAWIDDITVNTAAGGAGTDKPVSAIDYPSDTISNGLKEVTLVDTGFTGTGYTTYWYEVQR